jgi:hypothetical protein
MTNLISYKLQQMTETQILRLLNNTKFKYAVQNFHIILICMYDVIYEAEIA